MLFPHFWSGRGWASSRACPHILGWEPLTPLSSHAPSHTPSHALPPAGPLINATVMLGPILLAIARNSKSCQRGGERGGEVVGKIEMADFAMQFGDRESKLGES